MNFSIIGSGNIATYIGTRAMEAGNIIEAIISSNAETGNELAQKLNAPFLSDYTKSTSTTFLLAVPDNVIRTFASSAFFKDKKLIHTSGSIGLKEIETLSENLACVWPIFSIQKEKLPTRNDVPFVLQSSNLPMRKKAVSLLKCLTNNVTEATDEQKKVLHLSAVLVNNFTNHLFAQSEKLLQENNLSFEIMLPIIQNTVEKLSTSSPALLQTGPAKRGDTSTMKTQVDMLKNNLQLQEIYLIMSAAIADFKG